MDIGKGEAQKKLATLTRRERQVFDLTLEGLTIPAIASKLGIAPSTVSGYRTDMFEKLGLSYASEVKREQLLFDVYEPLAKEPKEKEPAFVVAPPAEPEKKETTKPEQPKAAPQSKTGTAVKQPVRRTVSQPRRRSRNPWGWVILLGVIGIAAWGIWSIIENGNRQASQEAQTNLLSVSSPTRAPTQTPRPTTRPSSTPRPKPTATRTAQPIPSGYVAMPSLVGLHYKDAERVIEENGLVFSISYYYNVSDLDLDPGTIKAQDPEPGTPVNKSTIIKLYRSTIPIIIHPSDNDCAVQLMVYSERGDLEWVAYLKPQNQYKIRTNFSYAKELLILNDQGKVTASGNISGVSEHEVNFTVPAAGYYTIRIPYVFDYSLTGGNVTNEQQLSQGVRSGCLGLYEN